MKMLVVCVQKRSAQDLDVLSNFSTADCAVQLLRGGWLQRSIGLPCGSFSGFVWAETKGAGVQKVGESGGGEPARGR